MLVQLAFSFATVLGVASLQFCVFRKKLRNQDWLTLGLIYLLTLLVIAFMVFQISSPIAMLTKFLQSFTNGIYHLLGE